MCSRAKSRSRKEEKAKTGLPMHYTGGTEDLPEIGKLRSGFQSLAMLDAILSPEWEYRYFSFNAHWAEGQAMASLRDGTSDEAFFLFHDAGVAGKIFTKELAAPPGSVLRQVPDLFQDFKSELAFSLDAITCCLWRAADADNWSMAPEMELVPWLGFATDGPSYYQAWATEYYEMEVSLRSVERLFRHEPLTPELVSTLHPSLGFESLLDDGKEIGYPIEG